MKGIFIVGAGPAGMFAARQVALAGYDAFIFNRDIKPGGLAEYGIYPSKEKMKAGLRKQFAQVLNLPNVHYFGHVRVGADYDVSIDELKAMRPAAIIFACGAQGTRKLGLPGEDARGVYAAKDFVYHYNRLPPFATMDFSTGKRVAIVGVGNVAIDIARWLLEDDPAHAAESVTVIARRGPLEVKFDEKEIEFVERHICRDELTAELDRVKERCARCNQDVSPEKIFQDHFRLMKDPNFAFVPPRLSFRFLSSPTAILPDASGRIARLEVAENDLVLKPDGSTSAVSNNERALLDVDTLIFAIGDKHDAKIGLPMGPEGYATEPHAAPSDVPHFEVWNPEAGNRLDGFYVVGWARKASTGLAGIARHDGEAGAAKTIEFVNSLPDSQTMSDEQVLSLLQKKDLRPVTKADLALLGSAEVQEAQALQVPSFKYSDDDAMFKAIEKQRAQSMAQQEEERCLPAD